MFSPQQNLQRATELGFEAILEQTDDQLRWLGAEPAADAWRLPVLNERLAVDLAANRVTDGTGREISPQWRILVLHYLAAPASALPTRPTLQPPEVTFADLSTARSYQSVYRQRTTDWLCATVGRERGSLQSTAAALGGRLAAGGDAAFDFDVFPRVPIRLIWHAPDDEFPPTATLLLAANIEAFFCAEDIVVLSERLVARLCGKPF